MAYHPPTYDLCREEGDGPVVSIDIHGRLDPHELDLLLAHIDAYPDEYDLPWDYDQEDYAAPYRGYNVSACVRRTVHPQDCDDPGGEDCWCGWNEWAYAEIGSEGVPTLRDGETFVTRLEIDTTWPHRCYRHLDRVATIGLPENNFLPPGHDEDPAPIIDGYLYVCTGCHQAIERRLRQQADVWRAEIDRRRAAGVPERMVYV